MLKGKAPALFAEAITQVTALLEDLIPRAACVKTIRRLRKLRGRGVSRCRTHFIVPLQRFTVPFSEYASSVRCSWTNPWTLYEGA